MIEVNSAAVVTVPGEGCKFEFKVSDILTPATSLTRYKTTKIDMCYFGDTINLLAKAVRERQSFPLTDILPDTELYRYGRNDGKCFALCIRVQDVKITKTFF